MSWFRMDDAWGSHPKVQACPSGARLLWVYGGLYSAQHLTDGTIPKAAVPMLLAAAGGVSKAAPGQLVKAGLWLDCGDTYRMHDYHDYQPSRDDVEAVKVKRKASASDANHRRWHLARGIVNPDCPHCSTDQSTDGSTDPKSESVTESDFDPPSRTRPLTTYGCTHNSSSAEWADDDPAATLGLDDHLRAVEAGVHIVSDAGHLAECIRRRREWLTDAPTQPDGLVPCSHPAPVQAHDDCPVGCEHGWLHPDGPDGGALRCPAA